MNMNKDKKIAIVREAIGSYPDFPKPGILFRDVFGVFSNVAATQALLDLSVDHAQSVEADVIVGLDARGFLLGPLLAVKLEKPFVPIRKKGKLPGSVVSRSFKLEYGEDILEVQQNNLCKGKRVLVIDDLLATGAFVGIRSQLPVNFGILVVAAQRRTMEAAIQLLKVAQAEDVQCLVIIELTSLNGRKKLSAPIHSIIQFE